VKGEKFINGAEKEIYTLSFNEDLRNIVLIRLSLSQKVFILPVPGNLCSYLSFRKGFAIAFLDMFYKFWVI